MGKLSESLLKPAAAGAISAVISYIMFDGAGSIQIMDNLVPGWLLIGVNSISSKFLTDSELEII